MTRHVLWTETAVGMLGGAAMIGLGVGFGRPWLTALGVVLVLVGLSLGAVTNRRSRGAEPDAVSSEEDVSRDRGVASSRISGGVPDPDAADQHSTTGPTPNQIYVGRVAGEDIGSAAETTGAERRAWRQQRRSP